MGREIQKKKNRSGITRVKQKTKRTKAGKKKIDVLGNAIIAANWDKNLTLAQNYRKLGLSASLNAPTGGTEHRPAEAGGEVPLDPLHNLSGPNISAAAAEVRVERDPETGAILRVIRAEDEEIEVAGVRRKKMNPLNDPLVDVFNAASTSTGVAPATQEERAAATSEVVLQLEAQAAMEEEALKHRKPRHMSQREVEWIEKLVAKHGDNIMAMVRDRKLNPMQQTEGDIKRRLRKYRESQEQSTSQE
ncbi:Nucleolar protein 16 [Ascosphaera aggregata]|nr:Nucleolar protein 16 [Ascosphaera aggregata]